MIAATKKSLLVSTLRWIARVWGVLNALLISVFVMGNIFTPRPGSAHGICQQLESVAIPGALVIGLVLGWVREGLGGAIAVVSLLAFYLLSLIEWRFPGFLFALAAAPGFLFLIAWLGSRSRPAAG